MKTNALLTVLCALFLFLNTYTSSAQQYLQGRVTDADTREPVPFVNIGITKLNTGTVSDEQGRYKLRIAAPEQVVTFSSIGYHTENISVETLAKNGEVALRPRPYDMPTVELKASALSEEEVVLGERLEEQGHSIGFGSSELGTEIAAHIRIGKETWIKSAHFAINHAAGDSLLFRVNLYDFAGGRVGENLLPENVLIATEQKKGTIDADLSEFNLVVSRDVLLSLEWIKDDDGKGNVGLTFRSAKSRRGDNLYSKHTSQAPFRQMSSLFPGAPKLELGFYLTGKQAR